MFKDLKQFNLPELEEKVLKFWEVNDVFNKSVDARKKGKSFVFYEGPPTANGRPAIHHVLGRAFKDIILRYKTMRGYHVPRRAGWDTHGLPVEIEIEKELGLKSKHEIEKFGIAPFNERAKASVWKYKDEWEKLTARTGLWLDFKNPYITYNNSYIETLWWVFSQFDKNKLLKKSYKVVPFCPRCQTALSSHELAQPGAYKKAKDPSVYVKFKLNNLKNKTENAEYLLVWTTTPWTLPSNVAVAVNPGLTYTKYKIGNEFLWSYNPPPAITGVDVEVVEKISGKKLIGLEYEPLYGVIAGNNGNKNWYRVLGADFVETEQGTGLVHIAPAFGEDDFKLIEKEFGDLSDNIPLTIDDSGRVLQGIPGAGKFIKEADKDISADLRSRNLIYSESVIEHDYPYCWRCSSPLIYFARSSWFIEMSRLRSSLLKENKKVNWVPDHLKDGRFGEWLREVKDWAISRERYWGTPLPIWECESCDKKIVVSALADLDKNNFSKNVYYFARHGEAMHNVAGLIAAGKETSENRSVLTDKGVAQIAALGKKLKKEKIDLIISSPFYRTKQTAEILQGCLGVKEVIYDKRLEEINAGMFNGRPIQEHKDFFNGNPAKEITKAPPSGESLLDVKRRMFAFMKEIAAKYTDKKILIVSHGDPLWVLEGALNNIKDEDLMTADYIQPGEARKVVFHNYPYNDKGELDLHRPYIDNVYLKCQKCSAKMKRVKEVADVWFDSGAMPYAEWHYPFENKKLVDSKAQYPADYIVEGMDQTRGWFYTLLAISVALKRKAPYKTVMSFGLVLDKNGVKMSKSKGNVVDPWAMFAKYGADVVRWHFYTINPPGEAKRFDEVDLLKVYRRFFAIIYNCYLFLKTYGDLSDYDYKKENNSKNILDRWIMSRINSLVSDVTEKIDNYDVVEAGRSLEGFVDDLSRWYVRRSRRRFQKPEPTDLRNASNTLYVVLMQFTKLIAPFAPFFSEGLYDSLNDLRKSSEVKSVHLADWPKIDKKYIDNDLPELMSETRKIASDGLALRAKIGIKVRQPLQALKIKDKKLKIKNQTDLLDIIKEEVNVKEIVFDSSIQESLEFDTIITPALKVEGLLREFVRMVQDLRQNADYKPADKAELFADIPANIRTIFEERLDFLKTEANLRVISWARTDKFDAESTTDFDGGEIWLGIRK